MPRMYAINLGGGGVSTLVVATFADLPATAVAGQFALTTSDNLTYIWNGTSWVLTGGQGNLLGHSGVATIGNGSQTVSIVYPSAMPDTTYSLTFSITNLVDANPISLIVVGTTKLTTGFTATFNAPADSANYKLEWKVARAV